MLPTVSAQKPASECASPFPLTGMSLPRGAATLWAIGNARRAVMSYCDATSNGAGAYNIGARGHQRDDHEGIACQRRAGCMRVARKRRGALHRHLSSDLHHAAGRYLEEVGGVAGRTGECDEQ